MPPVICVVGRSHSGKTTLVEKLVPELKSRGYRMATVKHAQEAEMDRPGTDSWRHIESGSEAMVLTTSERLFMIKPVDGVPGLDEIARLLGEDYDIIIAEGFKGESAPKIEVQRNPTGPLLSDLKGLFAVVSDDDVETKARKFSWSDLKGLVDLIEEGFIKPNPEHVSVYVNGMPMVLTSFPKEIIRNLMLAMASSLKGAGEPKSLEFRLRTK
jgi:molybdopterin-guanine dinucleotide biosynthesis protein B